MDNEISLFKVFMSPNISKPVTDTLQSGFITQGKKVNEFEDKLKEWFNYPYILTLNSATSGLTLALRLLNLNIGDEVLSSPLTCFATNASILANNLKIKWVDVDTKTCNISLEDLKSKITDKTKAVIFVHWGGYPVNLNKVKEIQEYTVNKFGFKLHVIEDCAHSFGAEYEQKKIGTHGNICVFSLQAIKHLTTGDGGLIFLPTEDLYERAKLLRWYGIDRNSRNKGDFRLETDIGEWGYKFHMNDINATIGLENLKHIDELLLKNRANAQYYIEHLPKSTLLKFSSNCNSAFWLFTIKVPNKPRFIEYMKNNKVTVSQVHNRNDIHSCVKEFKTTLKNLDDIEKEIVCIPVGWWLTNENLTMIKNLICEYIENYEKTKKELNNLKIRELRIEDYDKGYLSLLCQLYKLDKTKVSYGFTRDYFATKYKMILNQGSVIFVLEYNGKIIGNIKVLVENSFFDNITHIEAVVIHKKYRGYSLGKRLVNYAVNHIRNNYNCYKIVLNCKPTLEQFYSKLNFNKEGEQMVLRLRPL